MFGDVSTHLGCLRNHRPHWGMSYECVQVGSELILCQVPIIVYHSVYPASSPIPILFYCRITLVGMATPFFWFRHFLLFLCTHGLLLLCHLIFLSVQDFCWQSLGGMCNGLFAIVYLWPGAYTI
jgi:hypothetical protein